MKCMFNEDIDCTAYAAQKELGYDLDPNEILEKFCPRCPKRPRRLER